MKSNFFQFLGLAKRAGKTLEGYNKCEDGVKRGRVFLILLSSSVSKNTLDKFKNYAEKFNVPIIENIDEDKLSKSVGASVIKVLGISDENISKKLINIWK